jgi:pimeloyl-ACP methyl ester carboxylesterase
MEIESVSLRINHNLKGGMKMKFKNRIMAIGIISLALLTISNPAMGEDIRQEDYLIDGLDPGIQLQIREKVSSKLNHFTKDNIVLFVHGATYPSPSMFDLSVEGYSFMEYLAKQGYDTFCLDIRGYGGSTRPPEMNAPPQENEPIVRTDVAVKDISAAVNHICKKRGVNKINLFGASWGTVTCGSYTSTNNDKVNKLILYAPVYSVKHPIAKAFEDKEKPGNPSSKIGAYRLVTVEAATQRWDRQIKPEDKTAWRDKKVLETLNKSVIDSDPTSHTRTPPSLRAPNGVLVDLYYIFTDRPVYDASLISVPTLIIRGGDDPTATDEDARGLFARLSIAPYKRYVVVGNGTHFVAFEKNYDQVFREVKLFLDEER